MLKDEDFFFNYRETKTCSLYYGEIWPVYWFQT